MQLYLVRHARPVVPDGVCYGSTDLAVDEDHQQSVLTHLVTAVPANARIYSSPLNRCSALAERLAFALGTGAPAFDARLVEMDFGAWEMQAWDVIPREEIDAWAADLPAYRPGGGECLLDVAIRVQSFYNDLHMQAFGTAVVIAHAGTLRLLLAAAQCATPQEMVFLAARTANRINYGELVTIDY